MKNGQATKEEMRLAAMPEHERKMREAALMASSIVGLVAGKVKPGVTLNDLEMEAAKWFKTFGAVPYNLGYKPKWASRPYPAILCTSVNNVIAHGIPTDYELQEGDIVCIDTGLKLNGVCGDCAITVPVGQIEAKHERLLKYANRACYAGIEAIKAGVLVTDIARAVESYAMQMGYVTNQVLSGHGIGVDMHEKVVIPFFTSHDSRYFQYFGNKKLEAGEVVCIEPMLTFKDKKGIMLPDGWTIATSDNRYSAMFEHMVLVKEDGYEVLTDHFKKV